MQNEQETLDLAQLTAMVENLSREVIELIKVARPTISQSRFLTDPELALALSVSRRTLQQWRTDGIIPYYQITGKIIYRESEIVEVLEKNYVKAFEIE